MPDFTTAAVGDDRHRRRHRLRAVHRHPLPRGPRSAGSTPNAAVVHALDTAGRAVLFAGTTVVISLLGLLLMKHVVHPRRRHRHRRSACSSRCSRRSRCCPRCSASSAATSTSSVCPTASGPRATIDESGWYRWSRVIQRHPWPAAILGLRRPARARDARAVDAPRLRRRRATGPTSRHHPPGLRPPGRRLRRRASTARCCSPPRRRTARPTSPTLQQARRRRSTTRRASRSRRPPQPNAAGRRRDHAGVPDHRRRRTRPPPTSSHHLRDDVVPRRPRAPTSTCRSAALTAAVDDFADLHRRPPAALHRRACSCSSFLLLMLVFRSLARAAQGRDHEPAVDRRRLRRDGRGVPVGLGREPHRRRARTGRSRRGRR